MAVYFTADNHFDHGRIIQLCGRPFSSKEEMHEVMVEKWNKKVKQKDSVYILGDFCLGTMSKVARFANKLNGKKYLIVGNHDTESKGMLRRVFKGVWDLHRIKIRGKYIVLCHYPMTSWHGLIHNSWHFYGHVHGRLNKYPFYVPRYDVGVDVNNFEPMEFDELSPILAKREHDSGHTEWSDFPDVFPEPKQETENKDEIFEGIYDQWKVKNEHGYDKHQRIKAGGSFFRSERMEVQSK